MGAIADLRLVTARIESTNGVGEHDWLVEFEYALAHREHRSATIGMRFGHAALRW